ncbi:phage antirepressor, partial [Clostridium perfringens]|uniref:phage antirepressor n=1 Tax=Clostridium perfringens TaxID=1502 RepID=UPI002AC6F028
VIFMPESDLFRLIVHSKLPYAEKFEKWVFDEILPSIRAKGIYATPKVVEEGLKDPTTIENLLTELKEEREQLIFELEESKEKVNYHDTVLNNDLLIPITVIAKDNGMSGMQMNKILNSLKVQYKISDKWVLYQDYAPEGYTHSKTLNTPSGR